MPGRKRQASCRHNLFGWTSTSLHLQYSDLLSRYRLVDGIRGPSQLDLPELVLLRRERDPGLRGEGLLSLAGRIVRDGRDDLAVPLYSELSRDFAFSPSIRERARTRLAALRGEGELGPRSEILLSRFLEQATDPVALFAMTVAGTAFRATRWFLLGRLAANPSANRFVRGIGARALAGLAAFGMEATAFPLAARMGGAVLGRESEWSAPLLGRELASSFLMLGALRAGGLLAGPLAHRVSLFRPAIQQAGMFGGILLGHELETRAGLRQRMGGPMALMESFSTLLQFNVAGSLSRNLLGEGIRRWESRTETHSSALSWNLPHFRWPQTFPALAWAGSDLPAGRSQEIQSFDRLYMSENNGDGSSRPRRGAKVISLEEYRQRLARPSNGAPNREEAPKPDLDPLAFGGSREFWLDQLRAAMMIWVAETPIHPNREFYILRTRLDGYSPELTSILGLLAIRRPLAAQLLAVRLDLVRDTSWLRLSPQIREAFQESARNRYPDPVERHEIFQIGLQRYLEAARFTADSRRGIRLDIPESRRAFEELPAELAEAWRDPLLTDDQFLHLSWWLGIFVRP